MIADLLQQSMAAHLRAAMMRRKRDPGATEVLRQARDLRLKALAEDPQRQDPAWAQEVVRHSKPANSHKDYNPTYPVRHDELMVFYRAMLGEP